MLYNKLPVNPSNKGLSLQFHGSETREQRSWVPLAHEVSQGCSIAVNQGFCLIWRFRGGGCPPNLTPMVVFRSQCFSGHLSETAVPFRWACSRGCPSWPGIWLPPSKWSDKKWVNHKLKLQCLHMLISAVTDYHFHCISSSEVSH